jgi:hypothetical protein
MARGLLAGDKLHAYNTEKVARGAKSRRASRKEVLRVTKFEDVGRKIDREVERLREVIESEVSPATRLKAAKSLRSVADTLAKLAADLESKVASKAKAE